MPNERYLIVAPQGLGDSLEATPFVAALRRSHPDATIDVIVMRSQAKMLFEGLPKLVSEVIYLPFWENGAKRFVASLARERRRPAYDALFMMYPAARWEYHLLARAFPARRRFAHRYMRPTLASFLWAYDVLVPVAPKHNVLRNLDLLTAAGVMHGVPDRYTVPADWIAPDADHGSTIVVHVGTIAHDGLESRRWPLASFQLLVQRLLGRGYHVTALCGPSERQETLELKRRVPELEIFEGSLAEVARFLSCAGAVICNDSGIGHLAAGVGAPVVALFGPTPLQHAPYGPTSHPLRLSGCHPCFDPRLLNTACALNIGYRCLREDLPVNAVVEKVELVLRPSYEDA